MKLLKPALFCAGLSLVSSVSHAAPVLHRIVSEKPLRVLSVGTPVQGSASLLTFSPDGKTLVSAGENCPLQFWDVATGRQKRLIRRGLPSVYGIQYSPDGRLFATASSRLIGVQLWDVRTGALVRTLKEPYPASKNKHVFDFSFAPYGRTLLANTYGDIQQWDVSSGRLLRHFKNTKGQLGLALSPNGKTLASSRILSRNDDNCPVQVTGYLWDVKSGKTIKEVPQMGSPLLFSPDSKHLLTRLSDLKNDSKVAVWSATSGKLQRRSEQALTADGDANPVTISPNGRLLVTGHKDKTIRVASARTGQLLQTVRAGDAMILAVAFSPDGSLLATSDWNSRVRVWRVAP